MSDALPQFDAQSRTLKTRFELDNPGFVLQPDMFVDVELNVDMPPAITVPADAVFDSGLRKTVFVDRGSGNFEARRVETGWRLGGRVEIVRGLMEGERVVAAANFLLDSESRMQCGLGRHLRGRDRSGVRHGGGREEGRRRRPHGRARGPHVLLLRRRVQEEVRGRTGEVSRCGPRPRARGAGDEEPGGAHARDGDAGLGKGGAPAAAAEPATVKDLVCGMDVDPKKAAAAGLKSDYKGKTYYFCAEDCKKQFDAEPGKFVGKQ